MAIMQRNAGDVGFSRAEIPLYSIYTRGTKVAAGTYWVAPTGLYGTPADADTYIVTGTDKRLMEIRATIGPKLTAGKLTLTVYRSSDEGTTWTTTNLKLEFDGAVADKGRYLTARLSTPLALNNKDLLATTASFDFELSHRINLQLILD